MRRETPAFAQQKWPGSPLYHYGLCELAQRQAVLVRHDKLSGRDITSDRAKVAMTAGCISKNFLLEFIIIFCQKKTDLHKLDFLGLTCGGRYNFHSAITRLLKWRSGLTRPAAWLTVLPRHWKQSVSPALRQAVTDFYH